MTSVVERHSLKAPTPPRTIGFITASAIVIANIIGTGIFTSLGFQLPGIQSGFALLMLWIVGGITALCGAICYGELSAALPRSGGEYHFLSEIYHPAIGFMAVVLSFMLVWVVALFHFGNLRLGSAFQNLWTVVKLLLISVLIGAGFLVEQKQAITFSPQSGDAGSIFSGAFAVALVYVMYSYSGWNASTYIIGEVKEPERNVPRSLFAGTIVVMAAYVLLNAVFLMTTPMQEMRGRIEVGLIAGKHIFGTDGGRIVGALICLGLVSTISSMTWIGPRVTMSMGEDHWLLRLLAQKNSQGVPTNAMAVQLLMVSLLLLTRSFESVVQYTQFSLLICSLLAVLGVVVLRVKRPKILRPYRVWLYPLPPIVFAAITFWMMLYLLCSRTMESLAGLGTAIVGFALYFCAAKPLGRSA